MPIVPRWLLAVPARLRGAVVFAMVPLAVAALAADAVVMAWRGR